MRALAILLALAIASSAESAQRSSSAKRAYRHEHPCPVTGLRTGRCAGYVIDHVVPLCAGGLDRPSNMAWQELGASKEKDKWERKQCRKN